MESEEQPCGGCGKPSGVVILTALGAYCLLCYELRHPEPAPMQAPQRSPPAPRPPRPAPRRKPTPLSIRGCRAIGFEGIPGAGVRTQRDLFALALARSGRSFVLIDGADSAPQTGDAIALIARPLSSGERSPKALPAILVLLQISDGEARRRLVAEGQGRQELLAELSCRALSQEVEAAAEAAPAETVVLRENGALPARELHQRIWSRCARALSDGEAAH